MNDERTDRKQRKAALLEAAKINAGLSSALDTSHGRSFLWWMLEQTALFQQPHSGNALNTAFACGKKEIGLLLLERLTLVDPAGFARMQLERIQNVNSSDDGSASAGRVSSEFDGTDPGSFLDRGGDEAGTDD